jgi:hypothetical protein
LKVQEIKLRIFEVYKGCFKKGGSLGGGGRGLSEVSPKILCCSECRMIVLLCCSEFHMIVLKVEQVARMQRRKDEERMAKEHMPVNDFFFIKRSLLLCVPHDCFTL